ncbi:hypothetical protein B0T14DRAFT_568931 [Immersiella caudata]|uniref:Uncharacterized protein n=1 Tax=Immersiella caudata TaxID=314043 RepID=A0AA40BXQ7_9PEZI|nr:hypothetical protein B0T14DRAFT_568931 [Immersiella caudata]
MPPIKLHRINEYGCLPQPYLDVINSTFATSTPDERTAAIAAIKEILLNNEERLAKKLRAKKIKARRARLQEQQNAEQEAEVEAVAQQEQEEEEEKKNVQVKNEEAEVGPHDDVNMDSPVENVDWEIIDSIEVDDSEFVDSEVVDSEVVDAEIKMEFKVIKKFVKEANTEVDVIVIDD